MDPIIIKGEDLKYWKTHSDLIDILNENEGGNELTLTRDLFPNFSDDDFKFLKYFLRKKDVSYTRSKKFGKFIYDIKGYTRSKASVVLDFIMYENNGNVNVLNDRRSPNILNMLNRNSNRGTYRTSSSRTTTNRTSSLPKVRINNNNKIPEAKLRSKSMKKRSKIALRTLKQSKIVKLNQLLNEIKELNKDLKKI